jgi:hypothetical protein
MILHKNTFEHGGNWKYELFATRNCHRFKGIASGKGVSTDIIDVQFRLKQSAAYLFHPWKVSRQIFMTQQIWERQCKMAGTGFHSVVANCAPIPRFATTGITPWQTALKCTADCQAPLSGSNAGRGKLRPCSNQHSNLYSWLWQSAVRSFT